MSHYSRPRSVFLAILLALTVVACASADLAPSGAGAKVSSTKSTEVARPGAKQSQTAPLIGTTPVAVPSTATPRTKADPTAPVRVGLLVPLTGPSAPTGQGIVNAAQLALFEVADERLILQIYDTQGTPEGAVQAATTALSQGVQLFLGPVFAGEVKAVTPQAQAAGVNVIGFSTDPSVVAPGVFVLGFLVDAQVREVVNYARTRGLSRFAVLAPDNVYGQSVVDALNAIVPTTGGTVATVSYFSPTAGDLEDVVRRFADFDRRKAALLEQRAELASKEDEVSQLALKRLEQLETIGDVDFDAVFIPEQGARLIQVATLLPFFDVDPSRVQLLGTMLWATRGLGREPALVGGLFPAPSPESNRDFAQRYRQSFNATPPALANHGYDAVALAAVLARSGSADPFRTTAITDPAGFAGVDGIFRFTPNGLSDRGFAIMQVTRDGAEVVSPARTAFEDAQF